jgi:ATP/maltotriose-dependent transcriptional regulator MalT
VTAFGVVAIAGGATAWLLLRGGAAGPTGPAACKTLPVDLAASWNPAVRAKLIADNPAAQPTATWLADILDHHAGEWPAVRRAICVDDPRDRAWSPQLLDDAAKCLSDTQATLTAAVVAGKDAGALVAIGKGLESPAVCGSRDVISRVVKKPTEPAARAKLDAVEKLVADSAAAAAKGDAAAAKALGEQALAAANASGQPYAKAQALEEIGEQELQRHALEPAIEHLKAAYFEYRGLGDQAPTYRTALMVTQLVAAAGKLDEAGEWLEHARAEAERTGATPEKRAAVDTVAAQLLGAQGKLDDAIAALDRSLPRLAAEPDPRYLDSYLSALSTKATYQGMAGHLAESLATARASLAISERIYGPDHPQLISDLDNIGLAQRDTGAVDDAIATLARSAAIASHLPADSSVRLSAMVGYADTLGRKDPKAAAALLKQILVDCAPAIDADAKATIDGMIKALERPH